MKSSLDPAFAGPSASGNPFSFGCSLILVAALLGGGCAIKFSGELLNPLNKSGRTETSTPEQPKPLPTPPPAATPTPTPEGGR